MNPTENYSENQPKSFLRKLRLPIIIGFGLLIIIFLVYRTYSVGQLIVKTNSTSSVIVTKVKDPNTKKPFKLMGTGGLNAKLAPGQYLVSVVGKGFGQNQVVTITKHKTTTLSITPPPISAVEPVTSFEAKDIYATGTDLTYLDSTNGILQKIDSSDNVTTLKGGTQLLDVSWSSDGTGIAQDKNAVLYKIASGMIKNLAVPFKYDTETSVGYSMSPNGQSFISSGNKIYLGDTSGNYKQIFTSSNPYPVLSAADGKVAIIGAAPDALNSSNIPPSLTIVNSAGKSVTKNMVANQVAWSPDGNSIAVSGGVNAIYDGTTLNQIALIPTANNVAINSFTWSSKDTLLYSVSDAIWSYDTTTHSSTQVTSVKPFGYVSQLNLNSDNSYLYALVQNEIGANTNIQLVRFGLKGQTVAPLMQQLQIFIPNTYNSCSINYINFIKPEVLTKGTPAQNCVNTVKQYLTQSAVDTSSLPIKSVN